MNINRLTDEHDVRRIIFCNNNESIQCSMVIPDIILATLLPLTKFSYSLGCQNAFLIPSIIGFSGRGDKIFRLT